MTHFKKAPQFGSQLEHLPIHQDGEKKYVVFNGGVRAGFPSPAEDFLSNRISLDERYLSKTESTFIIRVKGMSMHPYYQENDVLIIRSDYDPQNNDDVVVSINASDYTLKRYNKPQATLFALNPDYKDSVKINENDEVIILGVVDVLLREIKKRK